MAVAWFMALCFLGASVPLLYATTAYVRAGGLGETLARGCDAKLATSVVGASVVAVIVTLGWSGTVCVVAMAVLFLLCRFLMRRHIGGATGDTTGATIEVLETGALLTLAVSM